MICEALVVVWITTLMPDTGHRTATTDENCAATRQEAQDLVALRAATIKPPSDVPVRVEIKVYVTRPDGERVHVYDLPMPGARP